MEASDRLAARLDSRSACLAGDADAVTELERRTWDGITVYEIEFENTTGEESPSGVIVLVSVTDR